MSYAEQFRLFVDESGDHSSRHQTILDKRYLGVVGVAFRNKDHATFRESLGLFKEFHCDGFDADCPPVLHREDLIGKKSGFEWLRDESKSRRFQTGLVVEMRSAACIVFAVVVDKWTHGQAGYRALKHPYHYCLHVLLEKYIRFLEQCNSTGDVMAESRGRVEDDGLKEEYIRTYSRGTRYHDASKFKSRLTSKEIKIKKKESNIAGLQLADIFAFAATRDVLRNHRNRCSLVNLKHLDRCAIEVLQDRYYSISGFGGRRIVNGCGRVMLA